MILSYAIESWLISQSLRTNKGRVSLVYPLEQLSFLANQEKENRRATPAAWDDFPKLGELRGA
jgi:hypothetical protein